MYLITVKHSILLSGIYNALQDYCLKLYTAISIELLLSVLSRGAEVPSGYHTDNVRFLSV